MEEVKVEIETNGVLDNQNHEEENQHTTDIKEQEDEDGEEESADNIEFNCSFCEELYKQPKILSCLHIFCLDCVKKIVDTSLEGKEEDATLKSKGGKILINCPTCHQITNVSSIDTLPTDYVTMNMLELLAIKDKKVVCTSCKSQQPAVARCSDCANFLCPICVNAHQYMRCFENHKVVSFDDMKEDSLAPIHMPLFCPVHASENMKYFCNSCQVPICNECMVTEHPQPMHHYERITAVETTQIADMGELVKKCRGQLDECDEASQSLQGFLSELQLQRDNARGLIEETYQTYRAKLEKIKMQMLEQLEEMHSQQELKVMEMLHTVEKTAQRIEDGCAFGERVLKNGSSIEILLLKRAVTMQLQSLLKGMPQVGDVNKIEFVTDEKIFSDAVTAAFGHLNVSGSKHPAVGDEQGQGHHLQPNTLSSSSPPTSHGTDSSPTYSLEVAAAFASGDLSSSNDLHPSQHLHANNHQQPSAVNILANLPPLTLNSLMAGNNFTPLADFLGGLDGHHQMGGVNGMIDGGFSDERSLSRGGLASPASMLDAMPTNGTAIVGRSVISSFPNVESLGLSHASNGHHSLDADTLAGLTQGLSMAPMASDASLASLFSSLSTPGLTDLSSLLNGTSSSLSNTFMEASNLLSHSVAVSVASITESSNSGSSLSPGDGGNGFNQSAMSVPFPARNAKKVNAMQIRCKFGQQGQGYGQFNSPHGFCLGMDDDIVVADTMNHRIEIFDKNGEHKYQFGIPGKEEGQLWYPRKVAVARQTGKYIVCDRGNERSRMQIFQKNGHFIKKIAIRYIDIVAGMAISNLGHIVAVDSVTPTVFVISEAGDLVRWFDCSDYMREPSDIAICGKEYFVCDFKGHCVVVFSEMGEFLRRIGSETITTFPNGIDVSDAGDILVGDSHGNRFHVAVFQRTGALVGEFECPYIKVSRCCGLKITSEGYIVTLAKNNHYVLVLNTLYIA